MERFNNYLKYPLWFYIYIYILPLKADGALVVVLAVVVVVVEAPVPVWPNRFFDRVGNPLPKVSDGGPVVVVGEKEVGAVVVVVVVVLAVVVIDPNPLVFGLKVEKIFWLGAVVVVGVDVNDVVGPDAVLLGLFNPWKAELIN